MPLEKSASNAVREKNIREMIDAGHPAKQAVAAAYRNQREAQSSHHDHPVKKHLSKLMTGRG